jgi:hypothetical protein
MTEQQTTPDLDSLERATRECATRECVENTYDAYLECALWSTNDDEGEPLDSNYGIDHLTAEASAQMLSDVYAFLTSMWEADVDLSALEPSQIGHDLWLTRNGHGAGFWDRGLGELGDTLTAAAQAMGTCDLYVGDDGALYVS